jgi:hypothetical protein
LAISCRPRGEEVRACRGQVSRPREGTDERVDGFLAKPIEMDELQALLDKLKA